MACLVRVARSARAKAPVEESPLHRVARQSERGLEVLARALVNFEPATAGKWLQMLKDMRPGINRIVVLFDPNNPSWIVYVRALEAAAQALGVGLMPAAARELGEIEPILEKVAREQGAGLVVLPSPVATNNQDNLVALAAGHRLPAVYPYRLFVTGGGLMSYGPDVNAQYRHAADYIDRILKGEKPADLPVQAPTRYELVKTAKALGLDVPPTLLARADEVIE